MDCLISGISLYTQNLLLVLAYCLPDDEDEDEDEDDSDEEDDVATVRRRKRSSASIAAAEPEQLIPGVPNDLLLPGAIVTLAVVIVSVFALGRASSR